MKRPKASVYVQAIVYWMIQHRERGRVGAFSVSEIAEHFGVARSTVIQWLSRYDGRLGLRVWRSDEDKRAPYEVYFGDYVMRDAFWAEYEQAHHEVVAYTLWRALR